MRAAWIAGALTAMALTGSTLAADAPGTATAIVAGGCFWCTESDFEHVPGVVSAESGYIGGSTPNPTYPEVSAGRTGHAEAVRILYDPSRLSYEALLERYWRSIDPTVKDQQFCDHGSQYRTAIFYLNDTQRRAAEASRDALLKTGKVARIHTEIVPATVFYPAEEYHQDYYKKNPVRYQYYRLSCGRDTRLKALWGKTR